MYIRFYVITPSILQSKQTVASLQVILLSSSLSDQSSHTSFIANELLLNIKVYLHPGLATKPQFYIMSRSLASFEGCYTSALAFFSLVHLFYSCPATYHLLSPHIGAQDQFSPVPVEFFSWNRTRGLVGLCYHDNRWVSFFKIFDQSHSQWCT